MKQPFANLALAAIVAFAASNALAAEGLYGGISAVGIQAGDVEFVTSGGSSTPRDAEFDVGFGVMARIGNDFGGWRAELELGYQRIDIGDVSSATDGSGEIDLYTGMINGYRDFDLDAPVIPYISLELALLAWMAMSLTPQIMVLPQIRNSVKSHLPPRLDLAWHMP